MSVAGRPLPWDSRRLWSLWEMLEFNARDFYEVTSLMQHTLTMIEARRLKSTKERSDGGVDYTPLTDAIFLQMMIERGEKLKESLAVLGARLTSMAVDEMTAKLKSPYPTFEALAGGHRDISATLKRELTLVTLLSLSTQDQLYFEPKEPLFGSDVAAKFPSVSYEIDEAGKCLALERSTASAFHSIRCLEAAIRAMSRCLDISDPTKAADRSWFNMLKAIKGKIDQFWPNTADKMAGDGRFFEEGYAALAAMQNPWRNATMHLDQKYTSEEARHILEVVNGFMRKIAARFDEQGEPKA